MKKSIVIMATILGVSGLGIGGYYTLRTNKQSNTTDTSMSGINHGSMNQNTVVSATAAQYQALKGEAYDTQFVANMIVHHQGAIAMAELALSRAKHQELKTMAQAILDAQQNEIDDMRSWQKEWGNTTTADTAMHHSMMSMVAELEGKSDDAFDRLFLAQMIIHHQSALDMATPGATNASRQEVKDLTKAIVTAQSSEITQMRQWQKDWAYER